MRICGIRKLTQSVSSAIATARCTSLLPSATAGAFHTRRTICEVSTLANANANASDLPSAKLVKTARRELNFRPQRREQRKKRREEKRRRKRGDRAQPPNHFRLSLRRPACRLASLADSAFWQRYAVLPCFPFPQSPSTAQLARSSSICS
jgi:hypothetical protein